MELYQLRTFATVAKEGHLTRASERLHVSQPAVSGQIKALEEYLGVSLFERTSTGVSLTRAGQSLLPQAERMLAIANDMVNQAKALRGALSGKVRVGSISDPVLLRLGTFLSSMLTNHPLLDLHVVQGHSGSALQAVKNAELDAAFLLGDNPFAEIEAIRLRGIRYCIVGPATWQDKLAGAGWKEIAEMPWIGAPALSSYRQISTEIFRNHQIDPKPVIEADQEITIKDLVASGVGLTVMREDMAVTAAQMGELVIWESSVLDSSLSFIYLASRTGDPVIEAMQKVIREVWELEGI